VRHMRWQRLFADLEGQLDAAEAAELAGEVADRSRREAALLLLADRLGPAVGQQAGVHVPSHGLLRGTLVAAGRDWLLLEESGGADLLVPLAAVLGVVGIGSRADDPASLGPVARRLDLRWALRGLARSRTGVVLSLSDGSQVTGTLDRVGADHVDVAEHGRGEPRRSGVVRQVRLVPIGALAVVRSS